MSAPFDAWGAASCRMFLALCGEAEDLHAAYERDGDTAMLAAAIERFTMVLDVAEDVDVRSVAANGLGVTLWSRFERFGDHVDLDRAIASFRAALALHPVEDTPWTSAIRANLSGALRLRWRHTRSAGDLAEAVASMRVVVAETGPGHPQRCARLDNLGDCLYALHLHHGDTSALTEAVHVLRAALDCAPGPGDRVRVRANLAEALRRSHAAGDGRDPGLLDEAVEHARAAVAESPSRVTRARFRSNLALTLLTRHHARGRPADLAEAAKCSAAAVEATPAGHPNLAERASVLAQITHARLTAALAAGAGDDRLRARARTRRAVRRHVRATAAAVAATPAGHVLRGDVLLLRSHALAVAWTRSRRASAPAAAIGLAREVAVDETVPARTRVAAARHWAHCLLDAADLGGALEPLRLAVTLLPAVAPRTVTRRDRERDLAEFGGLASTAAACALEAGDAALAVALLEQGRGVLLGRALDARTESAQVREQSPELADRFEALRSALDRSDAPLGAAQLEPVGEDAAAWIAATPLSGEERHALAAEWIRTVGAIRALPGCAGFLRPPDVDDLVAAAAANGPVVLVNVSPLRCDALVLTDGAVRAIALPALHAGDLAARATAFRAAVLRSRFSTLPADAVEAAVEAARRAVDDTLDWLWTAVAEPVLSAVDVPAGGRLWWAPTGALTLLPLHAAAPAADPGRGVADRVVSSYGATVRGLADAWRRAAADAAAAARAGRDGVGLLVVATPAAPGAPELPGAAAEAAALAARHPDAEVLVGPAAVRAAVLDRLTRATRAHFACHAVSSADGPDAGLLLHDHETAPLSVADVARLRLTGVDLAYLSACDTSAARVELTDEALHVAGAFHLAGFPHVIGSLWAVDDTIAPLVAAEFHAAVDAGRPPAVALCAAVRAVRDAHAASPVSWAPFVHVGA